MTAHTSPFCAYLRVACLHPTAGKQPNSDGTCCTWRVSCQQSRRRLDIILSQTPRGTVDYHSLSTVEISAHETLSRGPTSEPRTSAFCSSMHALEYVCAYCDCIYTLRCSGVANLNYGQSEDPKGCCPRQDIAVIGHISRSGGA